MTVTITPLGPAIGAEVGGLDLAGDLGADDYDAIHQALLDHHVLVFRDQDIDRERHKALGRHFGDLHVHPSRSMPGAKGDPEIFTVKTNERTTKNNGGRWHMDLSCETVPLLGSLLLLTDAPPHGGDTLFANMHLAYETLSAPVRSLLLELTAHHDGRQDLAWYGIELDPEVHYPATSHPVVTVHPETGRPLLFVNEAFTSHIEGLTALESRRLLDLLFEHIASSPAIQCRVRWQPKTLVFWDNRCTQHFAVWDYAPHHRRGERVSILGSTPPARYAPTP